MSLKIVISFDQWLDWALQDRSIINLCDPSACRLAHLISCLVLLAVCMFFFSFFFFFSIHTDVQLFSRFSFLLLFFHFKSNIIVVLVIVQIFKQINSRWLNIWRQCEFIATPRASAFYLRRNLSRFDPAYHCVLVSAARLFCHFKFSFFSLFRKLKNIEKL